MTNLAGKCEQFYTPKVLPNRSGTRNVGGEYEYLTGILLFFRSVNRKDTTHTWMMLNVDHCEAFDDVLLYRTSKNHPDPILYLIQLKHGMTEKNIKAAEFKTAKRNKDAFHLTKYFDCIAKLAGVIDGREKLTVREDQDPVAAEEFTNMIKLNRNNLVFVLYTNRGCTSDCDFLQNVSKDSWLLREVIDAVNGVCSRFLYAKLPNYKIGKDTKSYLEKFFLLTKQVNINAINVPIMDAVRYFIEPVKVSEKVLAEIVAKFRSFVEDWSAGLLGSHFPLTKPIAIKKIAEILLEPYMVNLELGLVDDELPNRDVWDDLVDRKDLIIVNGSNGVIMKYLKSHLRNCASESWTKAEYQASELGKTTLKIVEAGPISPEQIYELMWKTRRAPLLLGVDSSESARNLRDVLEFTGGLFRAILVNRSGERFMNVRKITNCFSSMGDLTDAQRETLRGFPVKVQGRTATPPMLLRDLTLPKELMSTEDVLQILMGQFSVGNKLEELPEFFVDATLERVLVQAEALERIQNETFLVETVAVSRFHAVLKEFSVTVDDSRVGMWRGKPLPSSVNVILFKNDNALAELKQFCLKTKRSYHVLALHNSGFLEWIETEGTTENLRQFRKVRSLSYLALLDQSMKRPNLAAAAPFSETAPTFSEMIPSSSSEMTPPFSETTPPFSEMTPPLFKTAPPVNVTDVITWSRPLLISAISGMGKSVLIDYVAQKAPSDLWVLKVNLPLHKERYKEWKPDEVALREFLRGVSTEDRAQIGRVVFEDRLISKRVLLLLDGFDEIPIKYQKQATSFIKFAWDSGYPVLVTTRPVLRQELECSLNVFAYDISPFGRRSQEYVLSGYFGRACDLPPTTDRIKLYIDRLLTVAKRNLNDQETEFCGVPMQIHLLAECFKDDCKRFLRDGAFRNEHFDLIHLYRRFVDEKIRTACAKPEDNSENAIRLYRKFRSLYALRLLFPPDALKDLNIDAALQQLLMLFPATETMQLIQKDGIVVVHNETDVVFVHRSFGEYMAAEWMAENLDVHKDVVKGMVKCTFDPSLTVTRNVFDRILAEECPLHSSIIKQRIEEAKEIINQADPAVFRATDRGGRTFLHALASWGSYHPPALQATALSWYMVRCNDNATTILKCIPRQYLKSTKDDLLDYNPVDYAIASGSLGIADAICSRLDDFDECIMFYEVNRACVDGHCKKHAYMSLSFALQKWYMRMDLTLRLNLTLLTYGSRMMEDPSDNALLFAILKGSQREVAPSDAVDEILDRTGQTFLHVAAMLGRTEIVRDLLRTAIDLNAADVTGKTALHWAVIQDRVDIVQLLVSNHKMDIDAKDSSGRTALHYAIAANLENRYEIVNELIKRTKPDIEDNSGRTPFSYAFYFNQIEILKLLLKDVDKMDNTRWKSADVLFHASRSGQVDMLELFLSKGADIEERNSAGLTPLIIAASFGQIDALDLLLGKGAHIRAKCDRGYTALHWAACNGHVEVIERFSSKKVNLEMKDNVGRTALHLAASMGHRQFVSALLSKGVKLDPVDEQGLTPLHCAAIMGETDVVDLLLSRGARLEAKSTNHLTALHWAAGNGQTSAVELLLHRGANVKIKDCDGKTPLHFAAGSGHTETCEVLISNGADVEAKDDDGATPLLLAAFLNHKGPIEMLLEKGANVNATTGPRGISALYIAACNGHAQSIAALAEHGADLELRDNHGRTALIVAAQMGNVHGVFNMVLAKADIRAKCDQGFTALHWAAWNGHLVVIELFWSRKVNLEMKDNVGRTPLHLAALMGHRHFVSALLSKGVRLDPIDEQGTTPLHCAARMGQTDMVDLLLSHGATIEAKCTEDLVTALHRVTNNRQTSGAELLLGRGANMKTNDCDGKTPLHLAALNGHPETCEVLISNGADMEAKDNDGATPLLLATFLNHKDTIKMLLGKGANLNARVGPQSFSPLHVAAYNGHRESIAVLAEHEADLELRDNHGRTALIVAAQEGNMDGVSEMVLVKADIRAKCDQGFTALHWAAWNGHVEVIKLFTLRKVNLELRDNMGTTPLHCAAKMGQTDIVELLLSHGATIEAKRTNRLTALHIAAGEGRTSAVESLLSRGANIKANDCHNNTPLHLAALNGHVETCEVLISSGADVEAKEKYGGTPLLLAALSNHKETIKMLLCKGANVNATTGPQGISALHIAVCQGHKESIAVLAEHGADLELRDNHGRTALIAAAQEGNVDGVFGMVLEKADIRAKCDKGFTALHWAAYNGHVKVIELFWSRNVNLEMKDNAGRTALHLAALMGHWHFVGALLSKGVKLDPTDEQGTTPLHCAARMGQTDIVDLLLSHGATIEAKRTNHLTALHWAAGEGQTSVVELLLGRGANIKANDYDNNTPLHLAALNGHTETCEVLISNGADFEAKDKYGGTPLLLAAFLNHKDTIKMLLNKGANLNAMAGPQGISALHIAVCRGHTELISVLAEHGADLELRDNHGRTALIAAAQEGNVDGVSGMLLNKADILAKDNVGRTAWDWAKQKDFKDVAELLWQNYRTYQDKQAERNNRSWCMNS